MIAERPTTVRAGAETLEARLAVPEGARWGVVICHPHPLYGGDMDSPVVARMAEACADRGLATLRFNFRGVGASTGRHDEGRGEQDDLRACLEHLKESLGGDARVAPAGYSFGDYDVVATFEAPSDTTAAAIALAFGAGGALRSAKTTKLLSGQEWIEALRKAQTVTPQYRPAR